MSRAAVRALGLGACIVLGLVVAVAVSPGGAGLTAEIYLFAVGVLAVAALLLTIAYALPRVEPAAPARPPRSKRLGQLESVERTLSLAETSSYDLHHRLRPIVREIAAARLARHGIALDRQPDRARSVLGGSTWELVRPDREAPVRGMDRGYSRDELRAVVDALGGDLMALAIGDVQTTSAEILDEVERAVIGKRPQTELVLMGLLADGHVLIEDFPGLAKTLMARSFARVCSMRFSRIQFTPDLMPSDVTGSAIYDQRDAVFRFQAGPVFTNLLLADEINRAPPKTQAALLEAMQERQVTADGHTHPLEPPFVVLATQNPIEYEGTYPLPEAQLDRFLMRVSVGYPAQADERRFLLERAERGADDVGLQVVCDRQKLIELQRAVEQVHVSEAIASYMVEIVSATRDAAQLQVGASPRGSLALLKLGRCSAALRGRDFVTPEDVKAIAVPALAHRLTLQPELWVQQVSAEDVVRDLLDTVPVPPTQEEPVS